MQEASSTSPVQSKDTTTIRGSRSKSTVAKRDDDTFIIAAKQIKLGPGIRRIRPRTLRIMAGLVGKDESIGIRLQRTSPETDGIFIPFTESPSFNDMVHLATNKKIRPIGTTPVAWADEESVLDQPVATILLQLAKHVIEPQLRHLEISCDGNELVFALTLPHKMAYIGRAHLNLPGLREFLKVTD